MKNVLTISEFAKISGVSRQTLIYYDHIGLFSPNEVGENGYRYYTHNQIGIITVINILTELGVPLKDIKPVTHALSADNALTLFDKQKEIVNNKMMRLQRVKDMIEMRTEQIQEGKEALEKNLSFSLVEINEKVPFYIGKRIDSMKDALSDDDIIEFYDTYGQLQIPFGYTLGYHVEKENLLNRKPEIVSHICFRVKEKKIARTFMPKGLYVIGYTCGNYGKTDKIYDKLYPYLEKEQLVIDGDAFEEYLFDEITVSNPDDYILKLSVKVKKKEEY